MKWEDREEMAAWNLYFATIIGWQFHPGQTRDGSARLSVNQAASLADECLVEFRRRYEVSQEES